MNHVARQPMAQPVIHLQRMTVLSFCSGRLPWHTMSQLRRWRRVHCMTAFLSWQHCSSKPSWLWSPHPHPHSRPGEHCPSLLQATSHIYSKPLPGWSQPSRMHHPISRRSPNQVLLRQ